MKNLKRIIVILGGGRSNGNTVQLAEAFMKGATEAGHQAELVPKIKTADLIVFASPLYFWTISSKIKAFIERFYCIAEKDENPPLGRYEKYPIHDCALLMTSADNFFWTFEQAVSYYNFALINHIGFHDKGMLLADGCGETNGKPQISTTTHLREAYEFGKTIYR